MQTRKLVAPAIAAGLLAAVMTGVAAQQQATDAFARTWSRTDRLATCSATGRTWMWGPEAISGPLLEPCDEASGGERLVQYFDKSRIEVADPDGDVYSPWYVTNGLLAKEMITGNLQVGDDDFVSYGAAEIPVAGDYDDPYAPTYATFANTLYEPLGYGGAVIDRRIDRDGNTWVDDAEVYNNVYADHYVIETNHRVASVFWGFMNGYGAVYEDTGYT